MDRKIAPQLKEVSEISFTQPEKVELNHGVPMYLLRGIPNDTARIELYFDAGIIRSKNGLASFVNDMLFTGNAHVTASSIDEKLDYLGAFKDAGLTQETAVLTLYGLKENFEAIIDETLNALAIMDIQEKELTELVDYKRQKFKVNMEKTKFLAQREFQKRMYSNLSEYGQIATLETYDNVDKHRCFNFYQSRYLKGLKKVTVIGDFDDLFVSNLTARLSPMCCDQNLGFGEEMINEPGQFHVDKPGALQTTIRIGRSLFNKRHPDFIDFQIMNTILGEYFGSRLMTNIREDKGYTYGIGSMIAETKNFGYFMVATEVAKEFVEPTLNEIQKEFDRLKTELVSEEELDLVRNYILGQMLKGADGPYSMMDMFIGVENHDLGFDYYNQAIERVRKISAERIQELAQQYLDWNSMSIITAG